MTDGIERNYSQVAQTAASCVDQIAAAYTDFPWEDRRVYGNWTAQTYFYVRHATRLLALAAARCPLADEELHKTFLQAIREEQDHELLALHDLQFLGFRPSDFGELPETAAYRQTL